MKRPDFRRELRNSSMNELKKRREDLMLQRITLRFKMKEGLLKNPLQLRTIRRDIAILNTILKEKRETVK